MKKKSGIYDNRKWLIEKYLNENLSLNEVANLTNVGFKTIQRRMIKYNIQRRKPTSRGNTINVGNDLKEIIEGCLLGDGSLRKQHISVSFRYACKHRECIDYLDCLLFSHGMEAVKDYFGSGVWHYDSRRYRYGLWKLFEDWYGNGYKIVPQNINLKKNTLLWWYLGDGSINKMQKTISLATLGFRKDDVVDLAHKLENKNIICSIHKDKKPLGKYSYASGSKIYIWKRSVESFFNLIGECPKSLFKCFGYKWNR